MGNSSICCAMLVSMSIDCNESAGRVKHVVRRWRGGRRVYLHYFDLPLPLADRLPLTFGVLLIYFDERLHLGAKRREIWISTGRSPEGFTSTLSALNTGERSVISEWPWILPTSGKVRVGCDERPFEEKSFDN